ncbi:MULTISPECIES: AAA family ATPase [Rhodomicrobium]|uniref:AAA family ATPase n=1 Tax=Rhodomicrobium TaxID=1068 RepID=UPI001482C9EA|nr:MULTISPECIES: AAA family ATPase [Rhodomicrobium]
MKIEIAEKNIGVIEVEGLVLRLFGVPQLEAENGGVIRLPTKKAAALLAYLALNNRQPQPRAKLAALLWEDSAEQQARESLRQTLSLLRKSLPAIGGRWIATQGDTIALDLAGVSVDVIQFDLLAYSPDIADTAKAAGLYRDVFLDGLDLRAPAFESWLRLVRQQFREKALDVLGRLLAHHTTAGNIEGGISIATRILALDPLREDAHRALMELYGKQRRYAAAMQQYRLCADTLSRELNVKPEASTTALYRRIRELRTHPVLDVDARGGMPELPETPPPARRSQRPAPSLERRQITVLACGLQGVGALAGRMDPEELHTAIAAHRRHCAEIVAPFGGVMGPLSGDCTMIYFGYREADEHGIERAIRAGLALIAQFPRLGGRLNESARLQIGIATSPVVAGEFDGAPDDYVPALIGEAPRHAALLQAAADAQGVVVSAQTRALVGTLFDYRELPPVAAGPDERIEAWLVLGERRAASRFGARTAAMTPFIGRTAELKRLLDAWEEAQAGHGQIHVITGDAGIGKSRLARMVGRQNGDDARHHALHYQCSPFHAEIALYPFIQQLEHAAGFRSDDQPRQRLDKLEALLADASSRVSGRVQLFADLLALPLDDNHPPLGLTSSQQRRKTFAALLSQIEHLSRKKPLLMIFEDAHWADPSSLELLDLLSERVSELPILLMITSRPGFAPAWDCLDHVHTLPLAGLTAQDVRAMVASLSPEAEVPADLPDRIAARTDGVPLFVEELTKSMLEDCARQGEDARLAPEIIPATLQDALTARLDRLGSAKQTAQIAAIIGREFSQPLLEAVAKQPPQELQAALAKLTEAGLIAKRPPPADREFAFNHALVQEAAYQSLLKSRRQQLHALAAEAILQQLPNEAEGRPALLAHHYTAANMPSEALGYWLTAAKLTVERSANGEATAHLAKGLELLRNAPSLTKEDRNRWERQLLTTVGPAVMAVHGYAAEEGQSVFERAHELIDEATPLPERFAILCGLWNVLLGRSQLPAALVLAEEFLDVARASGNGLLLAHCMMGQTLNLMGEYKPARVHLQTVIDAFEDARKAGDDITFGVDELVLALANMSNVLWALGLYDEAIAAVAEATNRARQASNSVTRAIVLLMRLFVSTHRQSVNEATTLFAEGIAFCQEHGLKFYEEWFRFNEGFLLVKHGQVELGVEIMKAAMAAADESRSRMFRPYQLGCMAKVHLKQGNPEQALAEVDAAIAMSAVTGERQSEAVLRRQRVEILIALGRLADAREELAQAMAVAEHQGARAEIARLAKIEI